MSSKYAVHYWHILCRYIWCSFQNLWEKVIFIEKSKFKSAFKMDPTLLNGMFYFLSPLLNLPKSETWVSVQLKGDILLVIYKLSYYLFQKFTYRIYSNKRQGAYLIFCATSAALIQGQHLFEGGTYLKIAPDKFTFSIYLFNGTLFIC